MGFGIRISNKIRFSLIIGRFGIGIVDKSGYCFFFCRAGSSSGLFLCRRVQFGIGDVSGWVFLYSADGWIGGNVN